MQNYECKVCGAHLYWDTQEDCLKCEFCGSKYQPSDYEDFTLNEETPKETIVEEQYSNVNYASEDMVVYECKNCGGEVVALKTTMATICPYCNEAISVTSKSVGEFRPKMCIPFKHNKDDAMSLFKEYVKKSFLTPKQFKSEHVIEKMQGIFVPFYIHSMHARCSDVFEGHKSHSYRSGYDKVEVRDIYQLSIQGECDFDKIPTDASKRISNALMDAVEPYNYNGFKPYNPAFMAGFVAEQGDDVKEDMNIRAKHRAEKAITEEAKKQFTGYSGSIQVQSTNNRISSHISEYVMLPVWLLNVDHKGKKYTYAINGQTGKVVGELPMNKLKLAGIGMGLFLIMDIIAGFLTLI